VIQEFVASWPLFQNTYLVGWLIALLLALVGVLVVARDQIFIGAAVSQASTLGVALALGLGSWAATETLEWLHADAFLGAMAVAFSILAALLTARGGAAAQETHEAITGWVFWLRVPAFLDGDQGETVPLFLQREAYLVARSQSMENVGIGWLKGHGHGLHQTGDVSVLDKDPVDLRGDHSHHALGRPAPCGGRVGGLSWLRGRDGAFELLHLLRPPE
jgi:hypothetical protein